MNFSEETKPLFTPPYLVGPDKVEVTLNAGIIRDLVDDAWLDQQIKKSPGWAKYIEGKNESAELADWRAQARTPRVMNDSWVYVGWSQWWASYITGISQGDPDPDNAHGHKSLGVFDEVKNDGSTGPVRKDGGLGRASRYGFASWGNEASASPSPSEDDEKDPSRALQVNAEKGITPQLGLLEDDILYNLSLLCKNVLEPVKKKYPAIKIVSGFRQVNTGIGQHERGQAADIIISSAPDTLLYEVADFIAKTLQFDQVILNYSLRRSSWIHVSFSPTGLRREALTRDFDDTFHAGIYLIKENTHKEAADKDEILEKWKKKVTAELKRTAARHESLNPVVRIFPPDDNTMKSVGGYSEDGRHGTPDMSVGQYGYILDQVWNEGATDDKDWNLEEMDGENGAGKFTEAVVAALPYGPPTYEPNEGWGHILKNDGQQQWNGHSKDATSFRSATPLNNGNYFQSVDFIFHVGQNDAAVAWNYVGSPAGSSWDDEPQGGWSRTPTKSDESAPPTASPSPADN